MTITESSWAPSRAYLDATADKPQPARASPADAFNAARRRFLAGERIDMVALTTELGVARATLYRWTGDRDQLLAEVLTASLLELADAAERASSGVGIDRLTQIIGFFFDAIAHSTALRAFVAFEGERGFHLLTAPRGLVRMRLVAGLADLIESEVQAGNYRPPATPPILADCVVAIGERYLHNSGDQTLDPDPATARTSVALLMRETARP